MNANTVRFSSLAAAIAVFASGCASLTPGENAAVFGTTSGAVATGIASACGASPLTSLAIGVGTGAVVAATVYVVAKHQATERQRRVAEERARLYYSRIAAEKKAEMKKKKVRYIAVDTVKDKDSSPTAAKSVMIWDTQSEEVVGNNVYDVKTAPQVGSTAKFETYAATYVGSGN